MQQAEQKVVLSFHSSRLFVPTMVVPHIDPWFGINLRITNLEL